MHMWRHTESVCKLVLYMSDGHICPSVCLSVCTIPITHEPGLGSEFLWLMFTSFNPCLSFRLHIKPIHFVWFEHLDEGEWVVIVREERSRW